MRGGTNVPMPEFRILGPLEVVGDDGVARARRPEAARPARPPAPARERGRLDGAADRRALGRAAAEDGDDVAPERRLAAAQAARPRPARHAAAGLRARVDAEQLDLGRFERLVARRAAAEARQRAQSSREALALWRGAPLADLEFETVRAGGDPPARGAAARGARGADRRRPRARRQRRSSASSRRSSPSIRFASGSAAS